MPKEEDTFLIINRHVEKKDDPPPKNGGCGEETDETTIFRPEPLEPESRAGKRIFQTTGAGKEEFGANNVERRMDSSRGEKRKDKGDNCLWQTLKTRPPPPTQPKNWVSSGLSTRPNRDDKDKLKATFKDSPAAVKYQREGTNEAHCKPSEG